MHPSVAAAWRGYNKDLEGILNFMYADKLGLVTTGMGNLVDPIALALKLPWKLPSGAPAPRTRVIAAWNAVKNDPKCAPLGWKHAIGIAANDVRLTDEDVDALIEARLRANDALLAKRFSSWENRPADAQLAVHSMAWAMGEHRLNEFPRFCNAFAVADYGRCAGECQMQPDAGTVRTRNRRNAICLLAAKSVIETGSRISQLLWGTSAA